ncbi:MAG: phytoene desaturase family protein [Chitinophagales bacterium]|nr:phytoene desaturase family protein [Chitinophagales bacterium]
MKALIVGTGLGGLATALQLQRQGWDVELVEKHHQPGGRLNRLEQDGFAFDVGPSFFSMRYEFEAFFKGINLPVPFEVEPLDPLYAVFFEHRKEPVLVWRNAQQLANAFSGIEPDFSSRLEAYLKEAAALFHDTEHRIVKRNFTSAIDYLSALASVPKRHLPRLFETLWHRLERHFESEEARVILSLVAFFLGSTPFRTPAVYSLLNYVELRHDGYWNVRGGMYRIVEGFVQLLKQQGARFHFNREITDAEHRNDRLFALVDHQGGRWPADVFVINSDAAAFRGSVLKRHKFRPQALDRMEWTMAPFTLYLGVKGKINQLHQHNYFLGSDFRRYAERIFSSSQLPSQPYYYVNVSSKSNDCAPEGCENLFVLCPVPDLRFKPDWQDAEAFADRLIADLERRTGFPLSTSLAVRVMYTPLDWERQFNLYRGSGLGLGHSLKQVGALRPGNRDEQLRNVFYVGASTIPGTGLPMVLIGSQLVMKRIHDYASTL